MKYNVLCKLFEQAHKWCKLHSYCDSIFPFLIVLHDPDVGPGPNIWCDVNLNLNHSEETILGVWSWEVKFPKIN